MGVALKLNAAVRTVVLAIAGAYICDRASSEHAKP